MPGQACHQKRVVEFGKWLCEQVLKHVPHRQWVFSLSKAEVSAADIQAYCKKHLHDWKCPKEIAFVAKLPRNTMGKVLKEEVKKFF